MTLVVVDDLTFGPFFWLISRVRGPITAMGAVLIIYIPAQLVIVWHGTSENPSRFARFFLRRLDLERRSEAIHSREQRLKARVAGVASAVALSFLMGGVIPPMLLWRGGYSIRFVRRVAILTSVTYAIEFAFLHGFVPGSI